MAAWVGAGGALLEVVTGIWGQGSSGAVVGRKGCDWQAGAGHQHSYPSPFPQQELKLKDKECERLSKVREQLEQELEELTASLFEVPPSSFSHRFLSLHPAPLRQAFPGLPAVSSHNFLLSSVVLSHLEKQSWPVLQVEPLPGFLSPSSSCGVA